MSPRPHHRESLASFGAVVLALVAVILGGATERWAQSMVFAGLGALLLTFPPSLRVHRVLIALGMMLLLFAGMAFLPVEWFGGGGWRRVAVLAGVDIPPTVCPQPIICGEQMVMLFAGICWVWWLAASAWDLGACRGAARLLAAGIGVVAAVSLVAWSLGWGVPGWHAERNFGPFPNRNHTGTLFAVGGILMMGCGFDAARRGGLRALPWAGGTLVIVAALAANYSRGGLLVFLGGLLLCVAIFGWMRRSWQVLFVGTSVGLVVVACVLLFGGAITSRFTGATDAQVNFRVHIWKDTLAMIRDQPWCGIGLGSFSPVFGFYRRESVIQQGILHPESDWLQVAAELGWGAVLVLMIGVGVVVRASLPLDRGSQRRLRSAALAAVCAAVAHGLVDVPGHRLGCFLSVALIARFASRGEARQAPADRWLQFVWRVAGVGFIGAALWWRTLPDEATQAEAAVVAGKWGEAKRAAERAIRREPVNWRPYFSRASVAAVEGHRITALSDFRRARTLEPHFARVPLDEGRLWAQIEPELALQAWEETLRRIPLAGEEEMFEAILNAAPDAPEFRAALLESVRGRLALETLWVEKVPAAEGRSRQSEFRQRIASDCPEPFRGRIARRLGELGSSPPPPQ